MKVKYLESIDRSIWNEYLDNRDQTTFYHKLEWKEVIEKSFKHRTFYLVVESENAVKGILPLVHLKSILTGSVLCSMPFVNFGGIIADNQQTEKLLYNKAKEILLKLKGDYIELRHLNKSSLEIPVKTHKVSMTVQLNSDPEVLLKNFTHWFLVMMQVIILIWK